MNIESLTLNVCEVLNEHRKQFNKLSERDTRMAPFSEKQKVYRDLCVLHGAIKAYEFVLTLCEGRTMGGGEE